VNSVTVRYSSGRLRPTRARSISVFDRYGSVSDRAVLTKLSATTSASRRQ